MRARQHFVYEPEVFHQREDCYFRGYWQAYKYFADCGEAIDATIRLPFSDLNEAARRWLDLIRSSEAVIVHVRRGDYLRPNIKNVHGLCDLPYYTRAMSLLRQHVSSAKFFVFSDDPVWCQQAFSGEDDLHVIGVHEPNRGHFDLALMVSGRHHIIANSSFGWWAAWLARHDAQIVVAPTPWTTRDGPAPDLFPPGWIVLDRETGQPEPH